MIVQDHMRVALRPAHERDVPTFARWTEDPEVTKHLFRKKISLEEELEWFNRVTSDPSKKLFSITIDESETLIGNCIIHDTNNPDIVSFGILIGESTQWDRGYGTEAIKFLLDYTKKYLVARAVRITVDAEHVRAQECYRKCGFTVVEKRHNPAWGEELLLEYRFTS